MGENMKKIFKYLGITILLSVSFFYTEKAANVVKDMDEIMIELKSNAKKYYVEPIESIITNDEFIPGINGMEIDINESYRKMRYIGSYNEKYLEYKKKYVKNRLKDNIDKNIVSGNKTRKNVSLIFILDNEKYNDFIKKVNNLNFKSNFFISGKWFENNIDKLDMLYNEGNNIGTIGYNYIYDDSSYLWLDNTIKKKLNMETSYCLSSDSNTSKICSKYNNYTIKEEIISSNYVYNVKNKLSNGKIYIFKINDELIKNIEIISKYIISRGYKIVNLTELLKE